MFTGMLNGYKNLIQLNNNRNPCLTQGNIKESVFEIFPKTAIK